MYSSRSRFVPKEIKDEIDSRNGLFELCASYIELYEVVIYSDESTILEKIDGVKAIKDFFNSDTFELIHEYIHCARNYSIDELRNICLTRICKNVLSYNVLRMNSEGMNNKKIYDKCKFTLQSLTKYLIANKIFEEKDLLYYITLLK